MHFDIVTAVWGGLFRELFLKVFLPSLNTPGNLAALADAGSAILWIYTTPADATEIAGARLQEHLPSAIEVRTVVVDGIGESNLVADHYRDLTRCHQLAVRNAADRNAILVFLPGDGVWAEGSFASMLTRFEKGKRAVLTSGVRVNAETYIEAFADRFLDADNMTAPCSGADLVSSVRGHLHDLTKSNFLDSPSFTTWPSILIWPVGTPILSCARSTSTPWLSGPRSTEISKARSMRPCSIKHSTDWRKFTSFRAQTKSFK